MIDRRSYRLRLCRWRATTMNAPTPTELCDPDVNAMIDSGSHISSRGEQREPRLLKRLVGRLSWRPYAFA